MIVFKYGGKSLENFSKVKAVCQYIKKRAETDKIIVVVSAMSNETDDLLSMAKKFGGTDIDKRDLDVLLSVGETKSASLISIMLNSMNVKSKSLLGYQIPIRTMGEHTKSVITSIDKQKILDCVNSGYVAVVSGFQGVNTKGELTTLGRGGSDTTAVAIGAALGCEVEIYSDFDGIHCGDPKNLNYKKLDAISYDDLIKMSASGAKVMSLSSANLCKTSCTEVLCKNSCKPYSKGTLIQSNKIPFCGIATIPNLVLITVVFNSKFEHIYKTINYINENVDFYYFKVNLNSLEILIDEKFKEDLELKIAQLNNLLEDINV